MGNCVGADISYSRAIFRWLWFCKTLISCEGLTIQAAYLRKNIFVIIFLWYSLLYPRNFFWCLHAILKPEQIQIIFDAYSWTDHGRSLLAGIAYGFHSWICTLETLKMFWLVAFYDLRNIEIYNYNWEATKGFFWYLYCHVGKEFGWVCTGRDTARKDDPNRPKGASRPSCSAYKMGGRRRKGGIFEVTEFVFPSYLLLFMMGLCSPADGWTTACPWKTVK